MATKINETNDPKEFLEAVMTDHRVDMALRIEAAKALMPYRYKLERDSGKEGD